MAWNDPGGDNKDPWGNRGGNDGGPPDLDEAFRKAKQRIKRLFGGSGRGGGGGSGGGMSGPGSVDERILWGVLGLVILGWLASGFYIVQEPERGVVTRFGAFQAVQKPGPHWHWPWPIARSEIVNVARNRSLSLSKQAMLTSDENIVVIDMSVQYDVKDAQAYLFNVQNPDETLYSVIESVLREVVGKSEMTPVITEGRGEVADKTLEESQKIIDGYATGINIQSVNLQNAQPPEAVQAAFEDAIAAREDKQRFIQEAQAVRNKVIPGARGQAAEMKEQARAYKTRVVERAEGNISRFDAVLAEYQDAPQVTRKRLYMDTMERVLGDTGKVVVDRKGEGDNLIYMPLERMLRQGDKGSDSDGKSSSTSRGRQTELPSSDAITGAAASGQGDRGNRPTRSRESSE